MGGLGALVYDRFHPGEAAGIVLLAPYLGEDDVIDEVAVAGGLAHWRPASVAADDWQRDTWVWLRRWLEPAAQTPRIVLGWGLQDRLGRSNRLLADVLPPGQVFTTAGKHDWPVWRALWRAMLESGQVAPNCR